MSWGIARLKLNTLDAWWQGNGISQTFSVVFIKFGEIMQFGMLSKTNEGGGAYGDSLRNLENARLESNDLMKTPLQNNMF